MPIATAWLATGVAKKVYNQSKLLKNNQSTSRSTHLSKRLAQSALLFHSCSLSKTKLPTFQLSLSEKNFLLFLPAPSKPYS